MRQFGGEAKRKSPRVVRLVRHDRGRGIFKEMRIGLNLLYLLPGVSGGTETYAQGLLEALAEVGGGHKFLVFLNDDCAEWPLPRSSAIVKVSCGVSASNRTRRYLFEQVALPRLLRRHRIDLVHSLGYVTPLFAPCPTVVTIPDLNFLVRANRMTPARRVVLGAFVRFGARRARHVITISQFAKNALIKHLALRDQDVTVTHLGPGLVTPSGTSVVGAEVPSKYGLVRPFITAFGSPFAHKNIERLLTVFAGLSGEVPHDLVIIGNLGPALGRLVVEVTRGAEGRVRPLGYVPREDIMPLLGAADLLVFPSLYEGFGLPVLEAQAAGTPVACARSASLPEVAGNGAEFFDPLDVEDMRASVRRCLTEPNLRDRLRRAGHENVKRFSWSKTARETLAVYERVVQPHTAEG